MVFRRDLFIINRNPTISFLVFLFLSIIIALCNDFKKIETGDENTNENICSLCSKNLENTSLYKVSCCDTWFHFQCVYDKQDINENHHSCPKCGETIDNMKKSCKDNSNTISKIIRMKREIKFLRNKHDNGDVKVEEMAKFQNKMNQLYREHNEFINEIQLDLERKNENLQHLQEKNEELKQERKTLTEKCSSLSRGGKGQKKNK